MCTAAVPVPIDTSTKAQSINSRDRILARLKNARQQFKQASILVVLDEEKLELITFYKKADIVKDQRAILAKFSQVCNQNACKIERKNACRVIDLAKPASARVWRLFTEAVFASLTLQSLGGKRIVEAGQNVYLFPESEASVKEEALDAHSETKYHLRKADLQIVTGGYLLLAVRDSAWPPVYNLADTEDVESLSWKLQLNSTLYLLPTGQMARYNGGWIGRQRDVYSQERNRIHDWDDFNYPPHWIVEVRGWLEARDPRPDVLLWEESIWCSIEIPVLEVRADESADREAVVWKTVVWPAELIYVFLNERKSSLQDGIEEVASDPLTAAQAWFNKDSNEIRTAASKNASQFRSEAYPVDGNLFDDDTQFGSPQQFMSAPAQAFHNSQMVYPTPPEAINLQNTPGFSVDGAAQTPISAHPTQLSIYQSSPLAMTTDPDATHPHDSAISNFLQHNDDDDLFEDEEDQKLVQPSFGDEPNWDFFDRDTTAMEMKSGLGFDDLNASPTLDKSPEIEMNTRVQNSQIHPPMLEESAQSLLKDDSAYLPLTNEAQEKPPTGTISEDNVSSAERPDPAGALSPKVKDLTKIVIDHSPASPVPPSAKRRRSSAYNVNLQSHTGRDHKYALSGKYHFELRRPSVATRDSLVTSQQRHRSTSGSSSSRSSQSQASSDDEEISDGQAKLWTRYEPAITVDMRETSIGEDHNDMSFLNEIWELLEIISMAQGTEPFTSTLPPRRDQGKEISAYKASERWFMVAQVLTEQLTQSSVFKSHEELQLPGTRCSPSFDVFVENAEIGTNVDNASLGDLAAIQPSNDSPKLTTHTVALDPDRIRLRQADDEISAELSIIKYWETMNLQPLGGPKNVQALCLHPQGTNYSQGCGAFMRRIKETYTSCNFGTHERLISKGLTDTGLLSWSSSPGRTTLSSLCRNIGKILKSKTNNVPTIVYIVMPSDDLLQTIEICDAFLELFEALGHVNHSPENDVVLQLVPTSFVVDANSIVVRPQQQYINLALEVYNRTPCLDPNSASAMASAVMLERPVGRQLQFELNNKVSSPSFRSGHCLHMAYCVSSNRKWLVASWSDTVGNTALTMPYCLADESGGSRRPRVDALRHMCETSVHLMGRQKGQSWLAVAKVGIYEPDELQEWLYLTQQLNDEHKFISRVVILNVELQSRLSLHGPQMLSKQTMAISQPAVNNLSTPATTPQGIITSPDQTVSVTPTTSLAANAQTPPDLSTDPGAEADTYLSNPSNDAWAITLAFGLNQTHNFLEIRPAMASGLLLKRVPRQENNGGLAMINVNLIAVPRKGSPAIAFAEREQVLQDVLVQYRGLHVLAVVRGCVDDTENCIPWHAATAFRGAKVLERLM